MTRIFPTREVPMLERGYRVYQGPGFKDQAVEVQNIQHSERQSRQNSKEEKLNKCFVKFETIKV